MRFFSIKFLETYFCLYNYALLGCNISSCCCDSPSWKCRICKREGGRLISPKRQKISVPSKNCCWTINVSIELYYRTCSQQFLIVQILFSLIKRGVNVQFMCFCRCDAKALEDSLCKREIVTRDETITKWLDPEAAAVSRDALAKIVYSRLFDWYDNFRCLEDNVQFGLYLCYSKFFVLFSTIFWEEWSLLFIFAFLSPSGLWRRLTIQLVKILTQSP